MSISILVSGLLIGSLYGLVGMGLSLQAGVVRLINLAQGDILIGGGYLAIVLDEYLHWDPLLLIPVVAVIVFVLAYPLQRFVLGPLLKKGGFSSSLVATFGLSLILESAYQELFGANSRSLAAPWGDTGVTLLGVRVQSAYLVAFAAGVVLTALTWYLLRRSRLGSMVRAAASDPATARMVGVDVDRVFAATFGFSAVLAAVAGIFIAVAQSVTPTGGVSLLLFSFAVMAVAGLGNVPGAFVAGLGVGVFQTVSVYLFGSGSDQLAVYIAFFVTLVVRPAGLFFRRAAVG
jgi:branched-chain amino acid transport system permease protein